MHNLSASKFANLKNKNVDSNYSSLAQHQTEAKDDQEQGMINKTSNKQISKVSDKKVSKPKYYYLINSNIDQSEYFEEQSIYGNFRQLSLKNLIIFLALLLLVMFGVYKMIQQIYQIEHMQEIMAKKMNEKRINMQKEDSLGHKQQKIAQNSIQSVNHLSPEKVDSLNNRLEVTEQRFREKMGITQIINDEKELNMKSNHQVQIVQKRPNTDQKQQARQNQQSAKSKQEIESALQQREQDIAGLQNPHLSQHPILINQDKNVHSSDSLEQNSLGTSHKVQTRLQNNNPVIQNSAQYLWYNSGTGPIAKANITKQQAIKWKKYVKMIEIPLNTPCDNHPLLKEQYEYFDNKYQISQYNQLPICVVVPSYNNAQNSRYKLNLQSILQQNYSNYHVVFIDDNSDDHTGQYVKEYLTQFEPKYRDKVKVIINKERKMAMPNLRYAALHQCQENQLFIIIDGDDSLIGRQVFKLFSAVMQKRNLWVMWTNFLSPKGSIGYSRDYAQIHKNSNNYRKAGFVMSHLRAYYTKLFRLIKQEDLKDDKGEYLHAANDVAIGIPILEMAHLHTAYVPEISYFYNMNTGLNNHRVRLKEQKNNDRKIRKRPKYQALQSLDFDLDQDILPSNSGEQPNTLIPKRQSLQVMEPFEQPNINQMEYMLHQKNNRPYLKASSDKVNT